MVPSKSEGAFYEPPLEHSLETPDSEMDNLSRLKMNHNFTAATEETMHIPSDGSGVVFSSSTMTSEAPVNGVSAVDEVNGYEPLVSDSSNILQRQAEASTIMSPPIQTVSETQEFPTSIASPPSSAPLISEAATSFPAEPLSQSLNIKSINEEPRVSDLRTSPPSVPMTSEEARDIKSENHQRDLAADSELAEGLSAGGNDPIERPSAPEPPAAEIESAFSAAEIESAIPEAASEDKMDLSADTTAPPTTMNADSFNLPPVPTAEVPHHPPVPAPTDAPLEAPIDPAPTPAVPTPPETLQVDQPMTDAPHSPSKIAREREDEGEDEERAAKRAKPNDDVAAASEATQPEFKVPELPQATPSAPLENGDTAQASTADSGAEPITEPRKKFLTKALQNLKRSADARFYKVPVDYVGLNLPSYPEVVKQPMDLSTIEKKLKGGEYHSVDELVADFELMVQNSVLFNTAEHVVSVEGRKLKAVFDRQMSNLPPADVPEPTKPEKKSQKAQVQRNVPVRRESNTRVTSVRSPTGAAASPTQTFALKPDGVPLIRRDSTTANGRPQREIHPPKYRENNLGGGRPKKKKFQWQLKWCQEVLNELKKPKHWHSLNFFYEPVDPVALNIPTYHSVIKKPMDLHTSQDKLNAGQYENAKDFENDVRQIFKNCFKFNVKGDTVYSAGEQGLKAFEDKWAGMGQWLESHEPASGPQSAGSDDDEDESEEEEEVDSEEEDRTSKISALQKQIAQMSEQVKGLSQPAPKKKKTPPVVSKKGAKKEKKEVKKKTSSTTLKDKKPKKPQKDRFVTYNEKQYISSGISSLGDAEMQSALRIIQANVPALKNIHESEIELDIDELPNHVLLLLLKFLKKHIPEQPPDEPAPEPVVVASAASRPKKNKPMTKHEQEAQIRELQGKLNRFEGGGGTDGSPDPGMHMNPCC